MAGTAVGALPRARPRQASSQVKALLTAGVLLTVAFAGVTAEPISRLDGAGEIAGVSTSASTISPALPNTLSAVRPLDGAGEGGQVPPRGQAGEMSANSPTPQYPDFLDLLNAYPIETINGRVLTPGDQAATAMWPAALRVTAVRAQWCESNRDGGHAAPDAATGAVGEMGRFQITPANAQRYPQYDPRTPQGNGQIALALFDEAAVMFGDGMQPWDATRWCWR